MQIYDVYFHEKKIRYRENHEQFYMTLTGQNCWAETVMAETPKEAFRLARERHFVNCIQQSCMGRIVSPAALNPKFMYIEGGGFTKYLPHDPGKV